jgi:hypothetical protein
MSVTMTAKQAKLISTDEQLRKRLAKFMARSNSFVTLNWRTYTPGCRQIERPAITAT